MADPWAQLAAARHRFDQFVALTREAFVEIDSAATVTEWNPRAEEILGWTRDEVLGRVVTDFVLDADVARVVFANVRSVYADMMTQGDRAIRIWGPQAVEFTHKDGHSVLVTGTIFVTVPGDDFRLGGLVRQASDEERADDGLPHAYLHDPLTGLPNRTLFSYRLAYAAAKAGTPEGDLAVVLLDVDRFKSINDALGHDVGDRALVAVARRLRQAGHDAALLARFGGDEFLALYEHGPGTESATARAVAFTERAFASLSRPLLVGETELFLAASAGIAVTGPGAHDASEVLSNAESAMYRAKLQGGSSIEVFGEAMRTEVRERMVTESLLHRALERDELTLFYQPVVDVATGSAGRLEALIRWRRGEQGYVSPHQFIPVAEESGLIVPIGAWALAQACTQLQRWQRAGRAGDGWSVAVNLSARQIDDDRIVGVVADTLAASGLAPECLTLEITESALMRDAARALTVLRALKDLGVSLAVDDFGTGYSSLSYLQRLPLDILKIDRSFIGELGGRSEGEAPDGEKIVAALVNLAHTLGIKVVAEGVETALQLRVLESLGCDLAQGHLFAAALPADVLIERFGQRSAT